MKNFKSRARKKKSPKETELIIIDEKQGLIFEDEKALHGYFEVAITKLEEEYLQFREKDDFSDKAQVKLEKHLEETLDTPDQIWKDSEKISDLVLHIFMKEIQVKSQEFTYVAICYVTEEDRIPTFVLTHFPTRNEKLIQHYRSGEIIYDKIFEKVVEGALEGDSLLEGDPLAIGLYLSMLKVRSEQDIPQSEFKNYIEMREPTIEDADEIWRKPDMNGHLMVVFIKEFPDHVVTDLTYVTVTIEDEKNGVHTLLFSFPTNDPTLVDRYRMGENLQAEEVTQESSH